MSETSTGNGGSEWGCLPLILTILVLWALLFGVSFDGRHYGIGCSCDRGVTVDKQ